MTNLPPTDGDGYAAASRFAVPSLSPGLVPGLTATAVDAPATFAAPPAMPYSWQESAPSRRLGVVAFIVAVTMFVLSAIAAAFIGQGLSAAVVIENGRAVPGSVTTGGGIFALAAIIHVALGTALGIWAIVQGIVAVVKQRGRGFGVAAIIIAALAPLLSYLAFSITIAATIIPAGR